MGEFPENLQPEFRQKPSKAFQKTVWLQIYLPLILIMFLVAGLVAILWTQGVGTFSGWADTALVFLMIPAILVGLIILALIAVLCYGIFYIIGWLPGPSKEGQRIMRRIASETRRLTNTAVRPIFAPKAAKSAVSRAIRHLASIFSSD